MIYSDHFARGKGHKICLWMLVIGIIGLGMGCDRSQLASTRSENSGVKEFGGKAVVAGSPIVQAARSQIGKTTIYDPAYVKLEYPGGDLPVERGVCTDVVIRALRKGVRLDLQKSVHEDMGKAFAQYPKIWGLKKTDRNIDHRRVPNLRRFFERKGWSVRVSKKKRDYLAGDLVSCLVVKRPHIIIVSDKRAKDGTPLVIHNIGSGAQEENALFDYPITGHFRIKVELNSSTQ